MIKYGELGPKIKELRDLGYSYNQIVEKLNCSKSTVSYHLGQGQKEKTYNRRLVNKTKQHTLVRKIERFCSVEYNNKEIDIYNRDINIILREKIYKF